MKLEPKIVELLKARGIRSEEDIEEFFSERPQKTYDPFLLRNMREGVDLIMSAIRQNKKICIYGDYDADGITSTVIMMEVLSELTDELMYYIPSRFDEGYGLNIRAIDRIKASGAELIVTVDCGSVSVEEVSYARSLGMQVLVTDHHKVTDLIADCPVINPAQPLDNYPCSFIAGCGVAFKLCQALAHENHLPKSVTTRVLDMVGIGTIGDIVPLLDENRTFAKYGLRAINTSGRENLALLIDAIGLHRGNVSSANVSFGIVPHLNAAGRMDHAANAVELFLSRDPKVVREKIDLLVSLNQERKRLQEEAFRECEQIVEQKMTDDRFLLLDLKDAHEGITGIVAGKIKDEFYRPVVIFTPTGTDSIKGTGRSIEEVDLYDQLHRNEALFQRFGGHAAACGLTMKREDLPRLRKRLAAQMKKIEERDPEAFVRKVNVDMELTPQEINMDLLEQIDMLQPCGSCNERPVAAVCGAPIGMSRIGSQGQYLKFSLVMEDGRKLACVAFNNADKLEDRFQRGGRVRLAGSLSENTWNGRTEIQFIAEDLAETQSQ